MWYDVDGAAPRDRLRALRVDDAGSEVGWAGCGWNARDDAVEPYGRPLVDDPARIGTVTALGLDETLFARDGPFRSQLWSTQVVDVRGGQLLDVVAGRDHVEPCRWLAERPAEWLAGIEW